MLTILQTSSLEKILPKFTCNAGEFRSFTAFSGERFSYQIAYRVNGNAKYSVTVDSPIRDHIRIYDVKNVPVMIPTFEDALKDPNYIGYEPGMYPDALIEKKEPVISATSWYQSVWITVDSETPAGMHNISITFEQIDLPENFTESDKDTVTADFCLTVAEIRLPEQKLIYTQWFHTDCISAYYNVPSFCEEHWQLIEKFMKMASDYGINMILTPVFTPPLDTAVGGERPTAQLVKIIKSGDNYQFDFSALDRFIALAKKCGFKYFEMPHLFTQWGAKFTPKIIASENGAEKRIFGWDVAAEDVRYDRFLSQLIPALIACLKKNEVFENTWFHISDEPIKENAENYRIAKNIAMQYLNGCKVIDALSDYTFYESGLITHPVVSLDHLHTFLENGVADAWGYHCCGQYFGVSNRFITMPAYRNRYIACQLFKYNIGGFLQWGYNFYYSFLSKRLLNPFFETDADGRFPSGDAFSVYPCKDGPAPAIGLNAFYEAMVDLRAMQLLETRIGHQAVVDLLEDTLGQEIRFEYCTQSAKAIFEMRKKITNKLLSLEN